MKLLILYNMVTASRWAWWFRHVGISFYILRLFSLDSIVIHYFCLFWMQPFICSALFLNRVFNLKKCLVFFWTHFCLKYMKLQIFEHSIYINTQSLDIMSYSTYCLLKGYLHLHVMFIYNFIVYNVRMH